MPAVSIASAVSEAVRRVQRRLRTDRKLASEILAGKQILNMEM